MGWDCKPMFRCGGIREPGGIHIFLRPLSGFQEETILSMVYSSWNSVRHSHSKGTDAFGDVTARRPTYGNLPEKHSVALNIENWTTLSVTGRQLYAWTSWCVTILSFPLSFTIVLLYSDSKENRPLESGRLQFLKTLTLLWGVKSISRGRHNQIP